MFSLSCLSSRIRRLATALSLMLAFFVSLSVSLQGVDADGIELGGGLQIWDARSSWMLHLGYTTHQGDDSTCQQINLGLSIGL